MNFKNINIGELIRLRVEEINFDEDLILKRFKNRDLTLQAIYQSESLDSDILLILSKMLEYDFFRIYSQHIILYAPIQKSNINNCSTQSSSLPKFRKSIYTQEMIDFILSQHFENNISKKTIIERYNIPKTTLYKWIIKHKK